MNPKSDADWMLLAVELSRRGFPAPNPHVGCVIVKDGQLIGEGWHEHVGGPHAERVALETTTTDPRGATAYVTLEPCNHHGRTSPCSEALIAAGISRVVFGCPDPNPKAAGGTVRLKQAGVEVSQGLMEQECRQANLRWITAQGRKKPYVALKVASSLDGKMALQNHESKWITGPDARSAGQRLRADLGAVLVGAGTVQHDDPSLTVREFQIGRQPTRVILDAHRVLTGSEKVFSGEAETIHLTQLYASCAELLQDLWERGLTSILIEGGSEILSWFIREQAFDEINLFLAPKIFGNGLEWSSSINYESLMNIPKLSLIDMQKLGDDIFLKYHK